MKCYRCNKEFNEDSLWCSNCDREYTPMEIEMIEELDYMKALCKDALVAVQVLKKLRSGSDMWEVLARELDIASNWRIKQ